MSDGEKVGSSFDPLQLGRTPSIRSSWTGRHSEIRIYDGKGKLKRVEQPKVEDENLSYREYWDRGLR